MDEEKIDELKPILGQMCYDELEPIVQKIEKKNDKPLSGQFNFIELLKQDIKINKLQKINTNNVKNNTNISSPNTSKNNQITNNENNNKSQDLVNKSNSYSNNKNNILQNQKNNTNFKLENQINNNNIIFKNQSNDKNNNFENKSNNININSNNTNYNNQEIKDLINTQLNKQKFKGEKVVSKVQNSQSNNNGSGLIFKPLEDVLHESMIPYTEHVVMDRALPRVEDGLKPVQRRILYAMYDMGLFPDKPYRKSAAVVGECLGKYHPHGDSSVYDAAVRMAQDFSLKEPLIDGQGNYGSVDGDSAAAYRYTEMKLKPLALEILRDLDKDTVHWSLNFDDQLKEPDTLPGRFPNLLVNGAYGIAVGVATNIPPHNLAEVIDAVVAYIDKPSIDTKGLMKYIKGPDFPTGASIIAGDEIRTAYETGRGKITIRSNVEIETSGDRQNLVITEIPYQVNKAQLLQKIAQLKEINKEKLSCIQEIRDESDRNGIRAVIRLKKDANAKAVLDYLYKSTNLQITFGINMVAIAGGKPKQMGLLDIISYYVEYQRQVIYRRTKFDLDACKERAHILEGLVIAIQNIDEVIKIIKKSESVSVAKQKLKERFLLSDKQATAILEMRLSRLVNLEVYKIKQELAELKKRIEELTAIYMSRQLQFEVVKKEILEIKKLYKSPRKTKLLDPNTMEAEVVEPEEIVVKDYMLALTANKTIKAIPIKNYNLAIRELGANSGLSEVHTKLLKVKSTDTVLIITNKGNVFKTLVDNIPEAKWRERGTDLCKITKQLEIGEYGINIINVTREQFELENAKLVMVTKSGMIKKSAMSEYLIAKSVFAGIKLKDKDELVYAGESDSRFSLLLTAKSGMCVNIADDIESTGRTTAGVKAMALDDGDYLVNALPVKKSGTITVLTDLGYIKNVSIGEYEISSRNRKGLRITGKDTGKISLVTFGVAAPDVAIQTHEKLEVIKSKYIPYDNRAGKGKQIIKDEFKNAFEILN